MTNLLIMVLAPFIALAASPQTYVIPQDTQYGSLAAAQVYNAAFHTDVVGGPSDAPSTNGKVVAFLITNHEHGTPGEPASVRAIVRNDGTGIAQEVAVELLAEGGLSVTSTAPTPHERTDTTLTWLAPDIVPRGYLTYDITFATSSPGRLTLRVQYENADGKASVETSRGLVAAAQDTPVDVPGESEDGGVASAPSFLGVNFQKAVENGTYVVFCGPEHNQPCEEKKPTLGSRFGEAAASSEPGECRVDSDDIIVTAAYHDALGRKSRPAAYFMMPLYQSGQDFKKLVVQNEIDGIKHMIDVRRTLLPLWLTCWNNKEDQAVCANRIGQAQENLLEKYEDIQEGRKDRFSPVAESAVQNANESIRRSCGVDAEFPLEGPLEAVREVYDGNLDARAAAYNATQATFVSNLGNPKDVGDPYAVFNNAFRASYKAHAEIDEDRDEIIRLQNWEVALDSPKTEATNCEKEIVFKERVERTSCESGDYPEDIIREAPLPEKARQGVIQPPNIPSEAGAPIDASVTQGEVCGGKPGDPYWASDCSCKCGEVINLTTGLVDPEGDPDAEGFSLCQGTSDITRHDIFVEDTAECLAEGDNHDDEFF